MQLLQESNQIKPTLENYFYSFSNIARYLLYNLRYRCNDFEALNIIQVKAITILFLKALPSLENKISLILICMCFYNAQKDALTTR